MERQVGKARWSAQWRCWAGSRQEAEAGERSRLQTGTHGDMGRCIFKNIFLTFSRCVSFDATYQNLKPTNSRVGLESDFLIAIPISSRLKAIDIFDLDFCPRAEQTQ